MYIKNMGFIKEGYHKTLVNKIKSDINYSKDLIKDYNYLNTFINFQNNYTVYKTKPEELISSINFDIIAKYIYLNNYINKYNNNFVPLLYKNLIKSFNNFKDPNNQKNNYDDFLKSFHYLINHYNFNDILVASKSNTLIDGTHRLSIHLYYQKDVNFINTNITDLYFDYKYFKRKGLKKIYSDYIAWFLSKFNFIKLAVIPLNNYSKKEIADLDIYYKKTIKINKKNVNNVLNTNISSTYIKVLLYKGKTIANTINNKEEASNLFFFSNSIKAINKMSLKYLNIMLYKTSKLESNTVYNKYLNKTNKNIYSMNPKDIYFIKNICIERK